MASINDCYLKRRPQSKVGNIGGSKTTEHPKPTAFRSIKVDLLLTIDSIMFSEYFPTSRIINVTAIVIDVFASRSPHFGLMLHGELLFSLNSKIYGTCSNKN